MFMLRLYFVCMLYEGKIVVVGGWDVRMKFVLDVEVYSFEFNEW